METQDIKFNFPIQHQITITPEALEKLTGTLDEFFSIAPELAVLSGTGNTLSVVTDDQYMVFLDPQGYDYPRYRTPRIAKDLAVQMTRDEAEGIAVRKCMFPADFTVDDPETLKAVIEKPYEFTV